jgi:hypothetical protein
VRLQMRNCAWAAWFRPRRVVAQELMRRVFAMDALECPRCSGRMRILAQIHPRDTTRAILECPDLPTRALPVADPRAGTRTRDRSH